MGAEFIIREKRVTLSYIYIVKPLILITLRLKKEILLLIVLVVCSAGATRAWGQCYSAIYEDHMPRYRMVYGVGAGVVLPSVELGRGEANSDLGFKIGMMWGVEWGRFEFVPEVWYSRFGVDCSALEGERLLVKSVDVPLMFYYTLGERVRLGVGPNLSLMNRAELPNVDVIDGYGASFGRMKQGVGYLAALSVDVASGWLLDVRYGGFFDSYRNEWGGGKPFDIDLYTIDFGVVRRF